MVTEFDCPLPLSSVAIYVKYQVDCVSQSRHGALPTVEQRATDIVPEYFST